MPRTILVTIAAAVFMAAVVQVYVRLAPEPPSGAMGGRQEMGGVPVVPPVRGYAEGREILFIHTEASDAQVAQMLTNMMGSPVLVVPALAQADPGMLAQVYVFTNGVKGGGPFGFQPDVFDAPPGSDGYSPLRAVHLVTWRDGSTPRALRSAAEVEQAQARGEITVQRSGAVVNMPFITWPDGQR